MQDIGRLQGTVLLFGGPYSNLHATRALFDLATRLGISPGNVICSGDIVAYCGEPGETLAFVREWGVHCVMGNCEESLANDAADCGCGFDEGSACDLLSVEWYRYASERISRDQRRWMGSLPRGLRFTLANTRFAVIHGSVDNISEFIFSSTPSGRKAIDVDATTVDCLVGGHSGIPFGERLPQSRMDDRSRYWINTGVIGMPANDGTPDGWYLLLQPEPSGDSVRAHWQRLTYDSTAAARVMARNGLGPAYREALTTGLWPSMDMLPATERAMQGQRLSPPPLLIKPAVRKFAALHHDR